MDQHLKKNCIRTNVTVGNAWIICKSKSHPGFNYYFNTLSGEAVWNLSSAEVEKAKKKTKFLESQPGNSLQRCPEPKEPPVTPPFQNSSYASHSNYSVQNGVMLGPQCSTQPMGGSQFYNSLSLINAVPLNVTTVPAYNSNVWSLPPQTQFIISPLINQVQTMMPHAQLQLNKDSQHLSNQNASGPKIFQNKPFDRGQNLKENVFQRNKYAGGQFSNVDSDLRQKLRTVRNKYQRSKYVNENQLKDGKFFNQNTKPYIHKTMDTTKIDLTPLKNLAPLKTHTDSWYIVADTNTILNNFGFLTNLTDSDKTCHLTVPKSVMNNLQSIAEKNKSMNARRIVRFLTQQIDAGLVKLEEKGEDDNSPSNIFDLCLKLSQKQYHVVLLSDDVTLLKYKGMNNIIIMTIIELKELLEKNTNHATVPEETPFIVEKLIKITVPNDMQSSQCHTVPTRDSKIGHETDFTRELQTTKEISYSEIVTESNNSSECGEEVSDCSQCKTACSSPRGDVIPLKKSSDLKDETEIEVEDRSHASSKDRLPKNQSPMTDHKVKEKTAEDYTPRKRVIKLRHNVSQSESTIKRKRWSTRRRCDNNYLSAEERFSQSPNVNIANVNNAFTEKRNDEAAGEEIFADQTKSSSDTVDCSSMNSVIISNRVPDNNIIIDESSMSGAISNTESNVDTDSVISYKMKFCREIKKPIQRNIMVDIPSTVIEEHLSMRCEEWLFRFIQIMEEVLSQILQQDPHFVNSEFPPPWTLHEATQCIIKKFSHCCYVVDAANKLSIVLFELSDAKGKMISKINPSQYMEMYSYGAYLIKALQDVNENCQDLKTASKHLKELLDDIYNPHIDKLNNDSFVEDISRVSPEKLIPSSPDRRSTVKNQSENVQNVENTPKSSDDQIKIQSNEGKTTSVSIKEDLFLGLELEKSSTDNKKSETKQVLENEKESDQNDDIAAVNSSKPKIIRLFTKCPEFENRSELDYDLDADEDEEEYEDEDEYEEYDNEYDEISDFCDETETLVRPVVSDEVKIKGFISMFLKEINETYQEVMTLCDTSYKDLLDNNIPNHIKTAIGVKAEQAVNHIKTLCKSLDSILRRDGTNPDENIRCLLKKAGIEMNFSQALCEDYKNLIRKCKDQAEIFTTTVDIITKAAKL
ncbi:uncharacterized protein LOC101743794 [Bombyx mori]|uniref:PIN domain-containing protein n=1 Tax=Bombyx mori TaxID=7091 RepID=A0A8R2C8B1_BOMMO|nr:uncharacterized protein LOC101743794 [Bombyx mori]